MAGNLCLLCQLEDAYGLILYHLLEDDQVPLQHLKLTAHLLGQNLYHIRISSVPVGGGNLFRAWMLHAGSGPFPIFAVMIRQ